jgi:hypothetical protein
MIGAGVELLIMSGKKTVGQFTLPYISVGIHARIRWTETVKVVGTRAVKMMDCARSLRWPFVMVGRSHPSPGPNGIAHLNVTLRTFSNPGAYLLSLFFFFFARLMLSRSAHQKSVIWARNC